MVAAFSARIRGGLLAAVAAILLYHLANPDLLNVQYAEADIVRMALFVVVGVVTGKLRHDAERQHALAMTDDLTGLHNLRSFEAQLAVLLGEARDRHAPISMLVLDVDRLKSLNDRHGHLTGAEAVRTVGHLLADQLPRAAVASRYGGDEFVVALPDMDEAAARNVADRLRRGVIALAPSLAGRSFPAGTLTISIGMASYDAEHLWTDASPGLDAVGEALFRSADRALYAAKAAGRNRLGVASDTNAPTRSEAPATPASLMPTSPRTH
jgi:diguanylate cyclase (GGDEF)-like protein